MALCYRLLCSFWAWILSSDKITATASLVVCILDAWTLAVFVWVTDENVELVRTSQKPGMGPLILPWPTLSLDVLTVKQKELQIHKRTKYESKGQLTTDAHCCLELPVVSWGLLVCSLLMITNEGRTCSWQEVGAACAIFKLKRTEPTWGIVPRRQVRGHSFPGFMLTSQAQRRVKYDRTFSLLTNKHKDA